MQILSEKNKILSYYYVSRVDRGSLDTLSTLSLYGVPRSSAGLGGVFHLSS